MKLNLIVEPNAILNKPCTPVTKFNQKLKQLAGLMMFNMYKWNGLGLAAPQVGRTIQLIVMDTTYANYGVKRYIVNPTLIAISKETANKIELCLSFPTKEVYRDRPLEVEVEYQDLDGNKVNETFVGLSAQVIMHEMEHLRGITLVDDISNIYLDK
jgi:peptide deformylase